MDAQQMQATVAQIAEGLCPVCDRRYKRTRPRHTLVNHLRRSTEPQHVIWRTRWYATFFPHGKYAVHPLDAPKYPHMIVDELQRVYGQDMVDRVGRCIGS